jgi:hypothetical protein
MLGIGAIAGVALVDFGPSRPSEVIQDENPALHLNSRRHTGPR